MTAGGVIAGPAAILEDSSGRKVVAQIEEVTVDQFDLVVRIVVEVQRREQRRRDRYALLQPATPLRRKKPFLSKGHVMRWLAEMDRTELAPRELPRVKGRSIGGASGDIN